MPWRLAILLALTSLGAPAQIQHRPLTVDAGAPRGSVRFHTEALPSPQTTSSTPGEHDWDQQFWARFGDGLPDRLVIPVALGGESEAAPRTWRVFAGATDPEETSGYDFRAVDSLARSAAQRAVPIALRLFVGPPDGSSPSRSVEAARRIVMHFNAGWSGGFDAAVTEWQVCPGRSGEGQAEAQAVAQAILRYDSALSVGRCIGWRDGQAATAESTAAAPTAADDFVLWSPPGPGSDPSDLFRLARALRQQLAVVQAAPDLRLRTAEVQFRASSSGNKGAAEEAAFLAASLLYLQEGPVASVPLPVGSPGSGIRDEKREAVLRALAQMIETPQRLAVGGGDDIGYVLLAGRSQDHKRVQVLIANYERKPAGQPPAHGGDDAPDRVAAVIEPRPNSVFVYGGEEGYDLEISNLPWGTADFGVYRYRVDEQHNLDRIWNGGGRGGSLRLRHTLPAPGVELIVLQQEHRPVYDRLPRRRSRSQP